MVLLQLQRKVKDDLPQSASGTRIQSRYADWPETGKLSTQKNPEKKALKSSYSNKMKDIQELILRTVSDAVIEENRNLPWLLSLNNSSLIAGTI